MRPQSEITDPAADDAPAEEKQNAIFEFSSAAAHFLSANICKK